MAVSDAAAEPITITDGSLTGRFAVSIEISSPERGFSLSGAGDAIGGRFDPFSCLPCAPGSLGSLGAVWSGGDLHGGFTIDGSSYTFAPVTSGASGIVTFDGSWIAPAFTGELAASVTNPFTFSGIVFLPQNVGLPALQLIGQGLATVNLNWGPGFNAWQFAGATYTFATSADEEVPPIPEPGTILLVGTGLGLIARAARRRRT